MQRKTKNVAMQHYRNTTATVQATTTNTEAQTALTKINTALPTIQQGIQSDIADKGWIQKEMRAQVQLINDQAIQIENSNWQFNETKQEIIKNIQAQAENAVIQGASLKAGINLTNEQINNLQQQIENSKTNQKEMQARITQALSQSGLMDKEKSLLTTQTIIQAIGTLGKLTIK